MRLRALGKTNHAPHGEATMEHERQLLTYREVALRFGLKVGTLYALVHQRRIPHVRLGRRFVRFDLVDVERWVAAHAIASGDAHE